MPRWQYPCMLKLTDSTGDAHVPAHASSPIAARVARRFNDFGGATDVTVPNAATSLGCNDEVAGRDLSMLPRRYLEPSES
jgi:hypothetical protein